jgi:hypothetical protein
MEVQTKTWDFSRLPESEHGAVVTALDSGDIRTLIDIHDKYKLSPWSYCCDHNGLINWFNHGITTGAIKRENNG